MHDTELLKILHGGADNTEGAPPQCTPFISLINVTKQQCVCPIHDCMCVLRHADAVIHTEDMQTYMHDHEQLWGLSYNTSGQNS